MNKTILVITFLFFLISCGNNDSIEKSINSNETHEFDNIQVDSSADIIIEEIDSSNLEIIYTRETFFTEGQGWGYRILMDGKVYINQPHIPAITGNQGFSSEQKAQITADFAIEKIMNGISPPTISSDELESLGVLD